MATIAEYINKAYDLSRTRTQGAGSTMAAQASSMGARSAGASGLAGPIYDKIRAANERKANQATSDSLLQNEIARNQALAGGEQFDQNMAYQKQKDVDLANQQKELAKQQSWNNIWTGLGNLVGQAKEGVSTYLGAGAGGGSGAGASGAVTGGVATGGVPYR